jgi:hypothetical protein
MLKPTTIIPGIFDNILYEVDIIDTPRQLLYSPLSAFF